LAFLLSHSFIRLLPGDAEGVDGTGGVISPAEEAVGGVTTKSCGSFLATTVFWLFLFLDSEPFEPPLVFLTSKPSLKACSVFSIAFFSSS
jgi:hypothetical protein